MNRPAHPAERGFGMIEVIATVLLLAIGLVPLFDTMTSLQRNAGSVARTEARNAAMINALEYIRSVNVGQVPDGDVDFGDWSLAWKATPLATPEVDGNAVRGYHQNLSVVMTSPARTRTVMLYAVTLELAVGGKKLPLGDNRIVHMVGWTDGSGRRQG